jgi:heptosyltransferase-2
LKQDTHKVWTGKHLPKKILAIRLHALGDTLIALSYLQNLRDQLPKETTIDFLVKKEYSNIPKNLTIFNQVYCASGPGYKTQAFSLVPALFKILFKKYDVVLDLQNNTLSNYIRKWINPACYVEFDRFSGKHACVRNKNTINQAGFVTVTESDHYDLVNKAAGKKILADHGVAPGDKIIVLNPAGAFLNRNWPLPNYITLAKLLIREYGKGVKFLVLGTGKIKDKANRLKEALQDQLIDLVNKTSQAEALAMLQDIDLMVSEDGALLHMAYLSKKNTIGIIGSTRSDWVNPKLEHTYFFTSDDMACGNCMLEICKYKTNECMERVTPEMVLEKALLFLKSN